MNAQDGLKLRMFATYCGLAYLVLVFGGMLLATFLNLVFIPVLYVIVEQLRGEKLEAKPE